MCRPLLRHSRPVRVNLKAVQPLCVLLLCCIALTQARPEIKVKSGILYKSAASLLQQQQQQQLKQQQILQQSLPQPQDPYRCAKYCTCSTVQVTASQNRPATNLTLSRCESAQFSNLLTIDRRTHIIHISLPKDQEPKEHEDPDRSTTSDRQVRLPNQMGANFRLPRLIQFESLREIVIVNLRFRVCDSEIFKRGSRVRRLRLNWNHLTRLSKSCLRFLDKLVELNLDYNHLDELESALFSSLLNLKSLSIAQNRLTDLASHQFANLTQLNSLNLVGNSFKTINLHLFEPMQSSLRQLMLSRNQIKSFTYIQQLSALVVNITSTGAHKLPTSAALGGTVFRNLVKLNVDSNKFERIKLLQLHRFFNIKFLSIRHNKIATIRDRAFNGLKLIELNLAHNQLQSLSRCAFCNSTIKRLIMTHNNITLPPIVFPILQAPLSPVSSQPVPMVAQVASSGLVSANLVQPEATASAESSSQQTPNMLIISQSLLGPLYAHLEYLDLTNNTQLVSQAPDQLDLLLEPLLKLEYLNLASTGLEGALPSPHVFKNLRQLRYLNLSYNQLDQVMAEILEPLVALELLDMSHNKFSELEESFLVAVEELSTLHMVNFGSNPWYCSQCKVAPIYDWILRSPLYNYTCIAPLSAGSSEEANLEESVTTPNSADYLALLQGEETLGLVNPSSLASDKIDDTLAVVEFGMALGSGDSNSGQVTSHSPHDHLLADYDLFNSRPSLISNEATTLSWLAELASQEDDPSVSQTLKTLNYPQTEFGSMPNDFCLKCEFPSELKQYHLHELSPGDFKFCAGAAPRFAASEPKIGLTLAIVIISALLCIIIVVIFMYRKKNSTYYPSDDTDELNRAASESGRKRGQHVASMSSDGDQLYGDGTDYSSPPVSQSCESSFSQGENDEEVYDEDEEQDFEDEEEEEEEEFEDIDAEEDDYEEQELANELSLADSSKRTASTEVKREDPIIPVGANLDKRPRQESIRQASKSEVHPQTSLSRNESLSRASKSPPVPPPVATSGITPALATVPTHAPSHGPPSQSFAHPTPTTRAPSIADTSVKRIQSRQSTRHDTIETIPRPTQASVPSAGSSSTPTTSATPQGSQSVQSQPSGRNSGSLAGKRSQTVQVNRHQRSSSRANSGTGTDNANRRSTSDTERFQSSEGSPGETNNRASQTTPSNLGQQASRLRPLSPNGARLVLARQSPAGADRRQTPRPMRLSAMGSAASITNHNQPQQVQLERVEALTAISRSASSDATTADSIALEFANEDPHLFRPNEIGCHPEEESSYEPDPDFQQDEGCALVCALDESSFEPNHSSK